MDYSYYSQNKTTKNVSFAVISDCLNLRLNLRICLKGDCAAFFAVNLNIWLKLQHLCVILPQKTKFRRQQIFLETDAFNTTQTAYLQNEGHLLEDIKRYATCK